MLNYDDDPPTLTINEFVKTTMLDMLKPMGEHIQHSETTDGKHYSEKIYKYDVIQLREFAYQLMHWIDCNYQRCNVDNIPERDNLEDFTEEEKQLYLPMAFMLACADGNAFPACIQEGYTQDAYKMARLNGWDVDMVRNLSETVKNAK
jgi:hypothetical protein